MSNEHPWIHMNSSEFHKRCSWQVRFWIIVFTLFDLLLCVVVFAFVGFIVLLVFGFFSLCWLGAPKSYPLPLLQNMFFSCLGMSENEVTFFRFNVTILGSKKDTSCWDIPICSYIVLDMCFVASMLCWLAPSKTYPTEIYRFTLAQKASLWHKKITSDPHISKETTYTTHKTMKKHLKKLFAQKHVIQKFQRKQIWKKTGSFVWTVGNIAWRKKSKV